MASSPQASAPAADAGEIPSSLSLALAVSVVFLLVSVLPTVCAYIPIRTRKEKQRKGQITIWKPLAGTAETCNGAGRDDNRKSEQDHRGLSGHATERGYGRGLAFPKNTTALKAIPIGHHPLQSDLSLTGDQESSNNEDIWMVSAQPHKEPSASRFSS